MNKHEIVAEHGKRLVVSRSDTFHEVVERNRSDVACWPSDAPSQRMWALSIVVQGDRSIRMPGRDDTPSDILDQQIALAERVLAWVDRDRANPQASDDES